MKFDKDILDFMNKSYKNGNLIYIVSDIVDTYLGQSDIYNLSIEQKIDIFKKCLSNCDCDKLDFIVIKTIYLKYLDELMKLGYNYNVDIIADNHMINIKVKDILLNQEYEKIIDIKAMINKFREYDCKTIFRNIKQECILYNIHILNKNT